MAKSKGRLLAELLASDGKVKESKSALDIAGGKLSPADIPTLPNSKLENSSITIAGESTSLGSSVSLNTGHITEHTNYKYYTEGRARGAISAASGGGHGSVSYNSSTGALSVTGVSTEAIQDVVGAMFTGNTESGITVTYVDGDGTIDLSVAALNTGNVSEGSNLYHTTARARAAISATGSLSYNSTTGVISFTMPAQNTSNITEGSNKYYTDARVGSYLSTNGYATQSTIVGAITDSAPATLDTLNELAAALGDDANFSTTVTNSIATKLPLAGGTLTGALNAGGGINGLTLSNGISGNNFNITGVNQLTINDPGEGIVFGGGSTTMSLAIVDDATDRILRYSGTGAVFDVQGNITLTGTVTATGGNSTNWNAAYTYSQVGHVELDGTSIITGSNASNGTRTRMLWMRGKTTDSVNQINVRGADIEFGQGGTLDATPAFKFGHTGILTATGQINASGGNSAQWNAAYGWGNHASAGYYAASNPSGYTNDQTAAEILTAIKTVDGAGSGLDADSVDGVPAAHIIYADNTSGSWSSHSNWNTISKSGFYTHSNASNRWSTNNYSSLIHHRLYTSNNNYATQLGFDTYNNNLYTRTNNNGTWTSWDKIWHAGVDGSGSGLDADLLDGQHGSYYLAYGNLTGAPTIPHVPSNNVVEGGTSYSGEYPMVARTSANIIYSHNGIKFNGAQNKLTVSGSVVIAGGTSWHSGNDGSGSGLDADTLDGYQKADLNPAHSHYRWTNISASGTQARRFVIMRLYAMSSALG